MNNRLEVYPDPRHITHSYVQCGVKNKNNNIIMFSEESNPMLVLISLGLISWSQKPDRRFHG